MSLIVVGVDGSDQSRQALIWAFTNAESVKAAVQAVMVVDTAHLDAGQRAASLASAEHTLSALVEAAKDVCPRPPSVTYTIIEGSPIPVMLDLTRRADLIVLGARRMSSIRNPALGTVSLACTRHGACPVLVVPEGLPDLAGCADLVLA
jgi:nucleotide-binding universal stress UspA family protein